MGRKLDIHAAAESTNGWQAIAEAQALEKTFHFRDFSEAFAFMTRIAFLAEKADHHPEILNTYHKLRLRLHTHSAGGITEKDVKLASEIDTLLEKS